MTDLTSCTNLAVGGTLNVASNSIFSGNTVFGDRVDINGALECDSLTVLNTLAISPDVELVTKNLSATGALAATTVVATDSVSASGFNLTNGRLLQQTNNNTAYTNQLLTTQINGDLMVTGQLTLVGDAQNTLNISSGDVINLNGNAYINQSQTNKSTTNNLTSTNFYDNVVQSATNGVRQNQSTLYNLTAYGLTVPASTTMSINSAASLSIAGTTVTPTALSYISGASSNVQNQLNAISTNLTNVSYASSTTTVNNNTVLSKELTVSGNIIATAKNNHQMGNTTISALTTPILNATTSSLGTASCGTLSSTGGLISTTATNNLGTSTFTQITCSSITGNVNSTIITNSGNVTTANLNCTKLVVSGTSNFTGAINCNDLYSTSISSSTIYSTGLATLGNVNTYNVNATNTIFASKGYLSPTDVYCQFGNVLILNDLAVNGNITMNNTAKTFYVGWIQCTNDISGRRFSGNVRGDVTGNVVGNVVGNVTGNLSSVTITNSGALSTLSLTVNGVSNFIGNVTVANISCNQITTPNIMLNGSSVSSSLTSLTDSVASINTQLTSLFADVGTLETQCMDISYDAGTDKTIIANDLSVTKALTTSGAITCNGTLNIVDGTNIQPVGSSGSLKIQHSGEGHSSLVFYSGTNSGSDYGALYYVTNVATTSSNNYKNLNYFYDGVTSNEQGALVLTCQNDYASAASRDSLILRPSGHCIIDTMNYSSASSYPSVGNIAAGYSGSHILLGPNAPSDSKFVGINTLTPTERLDVNGKIKCTDFRCTGTNPQFDNNLVVNGIAKMDKMTLAGIGVYLPQTFYFTNAGVTIVSCRGAAVNGIVSSIMNIYTQCTSTPSLTYGTQTPSQYISSGSTIIWKPVNNASSTYFDLPCENDGGVPANYVLYFYVDSSSTLTLRAGGDSSYSYSNCSGGIRYGSNNFATFYNLGGYAMITCRSIKNSVNSLNLWYIST